MFDEFNEAGKIKKSPNRQIFGRIHRFFRTTAPAPKTVLEAVRQTLHATVCEKNCGKTVIFYLELSLRRFRLDSRL